MKKEDLEKIKKYQKSKIYINEKKNSKTVIFILRVSSDIGRVF